MKITFTNGRVVERAFNENNVRGYTAERIEISPDDINAMRELALLDINKFDVAMLNLEMRFPGRRPRGKR